MHSETGHIALCQRGLLLDEQWPEGRVSRVLQIGACQLIGGNGKISPVAQQGRLPQVVEQAQIGRGGPWPKAHFAPLKRRQRTSCGAQFTPVFGEKAHDALVTCDNCCACRCRQVTIATAAPNLGDALGVYSPAWQQPRAHDIKRISVLLPDNLGIADHFGIDKQQLVAHGHQILGVTVGGVQQV